MFYTQMVLVPSRTSRVGLNYQIYLVLILRYNTRSYTTLQLIQLRNAYICMYMYIDSDVYIE